MALDSTGARALCAAHALGADFADAVMIGRQWFKVDSDILSEVFAALKLDPIQMTAAGDAAFSEPFFQMLGSTAVHSIDFSDFEQATHIHDMNVPIPLDLEGKYSLVFDGGTLEHVFHAPQALLNCMKLLKVGGYFVQVTNGNNFMGHGFWQFSPELLYRVFSPENGFDCVGVFTQELRQSGHAVRGSSLYLARDPSQLGWRVELQNKWPTYLVTIAKKVATVPIFATYPQQSDYQALWSTSKTNTQTLLAKDKVLRAVRKLFPPNWERLVRHPFKNKAYLKVEIDDFIHGRIRHPS